jgi:nucleoside-diphosphate-sugar epimerase
MGAREGTSVVLGAGPTGRALVARLVADGGRVRLVTRSGRASIEGAETVAADVTDGPALAVACDGAAVVYGCVGLDYRGWPERWPPMMAGMIAGAEAVGARFVFMDNCYMYGPVDEPMREGMPGHRLRTQAGDTEPHHQDVAGGARGGAARGRRGPGESSRRCSASAASAASRPARRHRFVGDPDQPHSFTYVPDVADALVAVARADDAMGRAWNAPNAPP